MRVIQIPAKHADQYQDCGAVLLPIPDGWLCFDGMPSPKPQMWQYQPGDVLTFEYYSLARHQPVDDWPIETRKHITRTVRTITPVQLGTLTITQRLELPVDNLWPWDDSKWAWYTELEQPK